ncbi:MAG: hypothetical protein Q8R69_04880 [Telluria sp.]|nr:hypothetical protein [Telluria sp.]
MNRFICMALGLMATGLVGAKLPPLSEEAAAKAAEAKAKTGWSAKVDAYKLCLSQDKVAVRYRQEKGVAVQAAEAMPACQDPGPYAVADADAVAAPAASGAVTGAAAAPKK